MKCTIFDQLGVLINNKQTRTKLAHKNISQEGTKHFKQKLQKEIDCFNCFLIPLLKMQIFNLAVFFPNLINIENIKEQ